MARTQARIGAAIWTDPDWCNLTGSAQRAYLLLLTQPKLTLAGCLDWHPKRWDRLSADGAEQPITDALEELIDHRFVVAHDDELVVRSFVRNDLCAGSLNRNMVKGFWGAWSAIASPLLRKVVVDETPDAVWSYQGAEPPAAALTLRSEPPLELPLRRPSEPRLEPPSEPTSTPTSATCLLPVAVIAGSNSGLPTSEPVPVDEQRVNEAVAIFARTTAERSNADDPSAYAVSVGRSVTDSERDLLRGCLATGGEPADAAAKLIEHRGSRRAVAPTVDPEAVALAAERARRAEEATRARLADAAAVVVGDGRSGAAAARARLRPVPDAEVAS